MDKFFATSLKNTITVDSVITVHYFKYAKNYFFEVGESHDFYELLYIDSGAVEILNGLDAFTLTQGQAFIHRPNIFHNIRAKNVFANIIILTFQCRQIGEYDLFDHILQTTYAEKQLLLEIITESSDTFVEPLNIVDLVKMTLKRNCPFNSLQIIKNDIEKILIFLCRHNTLPNNATITNSTTNPLPNELYLKMCDYIDNSLTIDLDLSTLSTHFGYSISYLKKIFRTHAHCGIIHYYLMQKIERAKLLISENQLTLGQISDCLNFSSPQYFSLLFKKFTNMTPSAYRLTIECSKIIP